MAFRQGSMVSRLTCCTAGVRPGSPARAGGPARRHRRWPCCFIIWFGWDYAQRGSVQTMIGLEGVSMFWAYLAMPVGSVFAALGVIGAFLDPRRRELETAQ
jgi:hypothetical protein